MSRPRLLDLCCAQGGASMGYHRAGFEVVGVDLALRRLPDGTLVPDKAVPERYPFEFVRADLFDVLADPLFVAGFDAIHASPPCQSYSGMSACRPGLSGEYPRLIGPVRDALNRTGLPWVIENVERSGLPAQADLFGAEGLLLCGTMFGLDLYRHRLFETSVPVPAPAHPRHLKPASRAGHWEPGTVPSVAGHERVDVSRPAMDIWWMTREGISEAIPPAYTEYIGGFLLDAIRERAA